MGATIFLRIAVFNLDQIIFLILNKNSYIPFGSENDIFLHSHTHKSCLIGVEFDIIVGILFLHFNYFLIYINIAHLSYPKVRVIGINLTSLLSNRNIQSTLKL